MTIFESRLNSFSSPAIVRGPAPIKSLVKVFNPLPDAKISAIKICTNDHS